MPTHLSPREIQEALNILNEYDREDPAPTGMLLMMAELEEKLGEGIRSGEMLRRLAACLDEHSDQDILYWTQVQLSEYSQIDSSFLEELNLVKEILKAKKGTTAATPHDQRIIHTFDVPSEIILARRLSRSKILNRETYRLVLEDLCAPENTRSMSPTTVLHVAQNRLVPALGHIVEYLVQDGSLPMVNLNCFMPPPEVYFSLPPVFVQHRAASVFGLIGEDAMVAVLNPYNESIQEDAATIIGRTCHFYIATAEGYDGLLRRAVEGVDMTITE